MNQFSRYIIAFLILLMSGWMTDGLKATHIVGGQISYRHLGNKWYEISIEVRRDCRYGAADARFDDEAIVGVFDGNGRQLGSIGLGGLLYLPYQMDDTLREVPSSICILPPYDPVCVHRTVYTYQIRLNDAPSTGYIFAYQRCCRNGTLTNIEDPLETGMTLAVHLTREAWEIGNSQIEWERDDWPPVYACADQEFTHSMFKADPDGDSLVYRLVSPYSGASIQDPRPNRPSLPPYRNDTVVWRNPYSLNDLFGGPVPLTIDPNTGVMQAVPGTTGQFLVGVEVLEYRNGIFLSSKRINFELNVVNCSEGIDILDFEFDEDPCDSDYIVEFKNNSVGAERYKWYFQWPDTTLSSEEENPTYTYPGRGSYTVVLTGWSPDGCVDTAMKVVNLYNPKIEVGFTADGGCGDSLQVTLCDESTGLYPFVDWKWTIELDGQVYNGTGQKTQILLNSSGPAVITLMVTDSVGCTGMKTDTVELDFVVANFEASKDSCDNGLDMSFINLSTGADSYTWYFNYPNLSDSSNAFEPTFIYPAPGKYDVMLIARKDTSCADTIIKTITLLDPQLNPAFTANSDCGEDPMIMLMDMSTSRYPLIDREWTIEVGGKVFTANGIKVTMQLDTNGVAVITLKITDSLGCMAIKMDTVDISKVVADFEIGKDSCDNGLDIPFVNTSRGANNFTWYFDYPITADSSNASDPVFVYPDRGRYDVMLIARRDSVCADTIIKPVTVLDPQLFPDFVAESTCEDSLVLTLTDSSKAFYPIVSWEWEIELNGNVYTGSGRQFSIRLDQEGDAVVTLKITDSLGCMALISKTVTLNFIDIRFIADTITICQGDSTRLIANPDSTLTYEWKPTTGLNLEKPWNPWAGPDTTTRYVLCVSDSVCTVIKEVLVIVEPRDIVNIVGDTNSCDGKFTIFAVSPDDVNFEWSDDRNFSNIIGTGDTIMVMVDDVTTIYVRTDGNCPGMDSMTLYNRSVCLDFEKEINVCVDDTVMINVINCKPDQDLFIRWDDNDIILTSTDSLNIKILVSDTGQYKLYFMVANVYGCILRDSICINASNKPLELELVAETECDNPVAKFTVTGTPVEYYRWDFGDGRTGTGGPMIEHEYERNGIYNVKVTAGNNGCDTMLFTEVTIVFFEIESIDTIQTLCGGGMVELNPNGNTSWKYVWSPGELLDDSTAVNPKANVTDEITFRFIVMDSTLLPDCMDTGIVHVVVPPSIDIQITGETLLCNEDSVTLTANVSSQFAEVSWCDENGIRIDTGRQITVYPPRGRSCYIVKAIDALTCESEDTICIERYVLDYDLMVDNPAICVGDTAMMMITNMDMDTIIIDGQKLGQGDKITILVSPDSTTTFEYGVEYGVGCFDMIRQTITVNRFEVEATADPRRIPKGASSQLEVTTGPGWTYMWVPQDGTLSDSSIFNPVATPEDTTIYTVTVTDLNGCMASDTVDVIVIQVECTKEFVFIPNAFTPNNDGVNDILYVRSQIIDEMDLKIYNRWGDEVFSSTDPDVGWDGTYNGSALRPDVYSYYLWVRCIGQEELVLKGNITLLR